MVTVRWVPAATQLLCFELHMFRVILLLQLHLIRLALRAYTFMLLDRWRVT
jgi:hypothetical protein